MDLEKIQQFKDEQAQAAKEQILLDVQNSNADKIAGTVAEAARAQMLHREQTTTKVDVQNKLATPDDIQKVVTALNELSVVLKPESIEFQPVLEALSTLGSKLDSLPQNLPEAPEPLEEVSVKNLKDISFKPVVDAIKKLELNPTFDPQIQVKPADVNVTQTQVDLKPVTTALQDLQDSLQTLISKEQPETDLTPLIEATESITETLSNLKFPVPNYVLPFRDHDGKATQASIDSDNGGVSVNQVGKLVKYDFDTMALGYTSGNLTSLTYSLGGVTTTTLNLAYSNGNLISIARQ